MAPAPTQTSNVPSDSSIYSFDPLAIAIVQPRPAPKSKFNKGAPKQAATYII